MSNIGIIGYGIVGKAVEYGFRDNNTIIAYDKYKDLSPLEDVISDSEFLFVCLPTPFKEEEMTIDLSIMNRSIDELASLTHNTNKVIVIKSTVVPGTTEGYAKKYPGVRFCFNPEFLTEANYLEDFVNTDGIVLGSNSDKTKLMVTDLYRDRFPKTPIEHTGFTTAEMVKYSRNCFLATKVMFANKMYDVCEKLGISWEEVRKLMIRDKRIGSTHLHVTTNRGFDGKCFPKDLGSFIGLCKEIGVHPGLLDTVWADNQVINQVKEYRDIPGATSNNNNFTS